jgi:Icc-related predicted phosphoesterase
MKILALSDQVVPLIYNESVRERFADVELIVGCGDLPAYYLEYVVTQLNVPLVFVPGNHDPDTLHVPGGISVDGKLVQINGVIIVGLGGSRRYKPKGKHQYTEAEMNWRSARLFLKTLSTRLVKGRWVDLLITHAPPQGIHDASDAAHQGFAAFHHVVRALRPSMMLHGHSHVIRNLDETRSQLYGCEIVNVYPYQVVDFAEPG